MILGMNFEGMREGDTAKATVSQGLTNLRGNYRRTYTVSFQEKAQSAAMAEMESVAASDEFAAVCPLSRFKPKSRQAISGPFTDAMCPALLF